MMLTPPPRILPMLAGACAAAALCGCDSSAKQAPRAALPPAAQVAPESHALAPQVRVMAAPPPNAAIFDVFAPTSWQPSPAPSPPPLPQPSPSSEQPPAPPPAAPPMPFRFIGSYGDADSQTVMLVKDDKLYLVAVGETIENVYRIERVSGTLVELTYLPLKLKQSLSTGGAG